MLNYLQEKRKEVIFVNDINNVLAEALEELISSVISIRGQCHMVFPGGRTPRGVLEQLRQKKLPWSALHLYPSDERCVAVGAQERNDQLIKDFLIPYVPFPKDNLYSIPAELGPNEGAKRYNDFLSTAPPFDIVLLGVGEDGHIASLFPEDLTLNNKRAAVPIYNAPKEPHERVSIGLERLQAASECWVVICGIEKKGLLSQINQNDSLPVNRVSPTKIYIDQNLK